MTLKLNKSGKDKAEVSLARILKERNHSKTQFCDDNDKKGGRFAFKSLQKFLRREPVEPSVFASICEALKLDLEEVSREEPESDRSPNPIQNFTHIGTPNFVGRQKELALIHEQMQKANAVAISAVSGLGGVGKTELAIKYAREHEVDYSGGILWLNARDSDLAENIIEASQLEVPHKNLRGKRLSIEEQVAWCWQNWKPPEGSVLVIFDGLTELAECKKFSPKINRFRILITTRLRNLDTSSVEIPLDVLSPEEALQLLKNLISENRVLGELEIANKLCKWLGYLPLGIELAGRFIVKKSQKKFTLDNMLKQLEAQRLKDKALNPYRKMLEGTYSTAQLGLIDAFELTWEELDASTQRVGKLLSLFAPDIFSWESVESSAKILNWDKLDEANDQLYEHHLIQEVNDTNKSEHFRMHPLIREFLQIKLAEDTEQADGIKHAFVETFLVIAREIPNMQNRELMHSYKYAVPHLQGIATELSEVIANENLIWIFIGLAKIFEGQGLYALEANILEQGLSAIQSRLGNEHIHVASVQGRLGAACYRQGKCEEAEFLTKQAVELYRRLGEEESLESAINMTNLQQIYIEQGRYNEANSLLIKIGELAQQYRGNYAQVLTMSLGRTIPLFKDKIEFLNDLDLLVLALLDFISETLGDNNYFYTEILQLLATIYYHQRKFNDAESLFKRIIKLKERTHGLDHPSNAITHSTLASVCVKRKKYKEAELHFQKALELQQRLLGENHPDTFETLSKLANLYVDLKRYSEAEALLEIILKREKHPSLDYSKAYSETVLVLARLYQKQEKYDQAEKCCKRGLDLHQELLGEEHPDTKEAMLLLAIICLEQKKYAEAEPIFKRYLELTTPQHECDPNFASVFFTLGNVYEWQGKYAEAEPMYKQAVILSQRLLGEDNMEFLVSLDYLASTYFEQQKYDEAETLLKQVLDLQKHKLGNNHPRIVETINKLLILYLSQRKDEEADPFIKQALALKQSMQPEGCANIINTLNNWAHLNSSKEKYQEAEPLYKKALELGQKILGKNHPEVIDTTEYLAGCYAHLERYVEAERLLKQALKIRLALPDNHFDLLLSISKLANLYYYQEKYLEAEPFYEQALELCQRLRGVSNSDFFICLYNLASTYYFQNKYTEAAPLFEKALELGQKLEGENHPEVQIILERLANTYHSQEKLKEAETLYEKLLEIKKISFGEDHIFVTAIQFALAIVCDGQENFIKAEELLKKSLGMARSQLGDEHVIVAMILDALAYSYSSQGRYGEAETLCLQALEMRKRLLGDEHRDVATSLFTLARLYSLQQLYNEAEPLYQEALQMRKRFLGNEHQGVARILKDLASLYASQRKHRKARTFYFEALKIFEKKLGENHSDTIECRKNLESL
jgi:tetratricopeptide (TPR) repeat protein